jgi:glutamine synthetase
VWIDGTGENVRLKDRILKKPPQKPDDCPHWQYDGSSTYQALGENSDITLVPRALYKDPFKVGQNDVIVLCDTYKPNGEPCDSNHRNSMQAAYDKTKDLEPWFGIEQVRQ